MGGGPTIQAPQPTQAETDLQNQQTALLKQQTAIIQQSYATQNLLAPFLYKQLGLTPQMDGSGKITGFTQDPAMAALTAKQNDITGMFLDREKQALEGNLPIDPSLTQSLNEQEQKLHQTLAQQLGPNWASSTPGTTALNQWGTYRTNIEHSAARGDLTTAESLGLGMQGGTQAQTASFLQGAGGINSQGYGAAGAFGQNAQGYNSPLSFLENIRNQQFQASIYNAQQSSNMWGGLGSGLGSVLGMVGGGLAGNAGLFGPSSKFLKEDIEDVSDDEMLSALRRTPVKRWRYKSETGLEGDEHIGPMAEDFHENLRLKPKDRIYFTDALGAHHSAIKAIANRVDTLERASFLKAA